MRAGGALLALVLGASAALAQEAPFDGDWALGDAEACFSGDGDALNPVLRIRGDQMQRPAGLCRLTDPQPIADLGATLYMLDCTGEGEHWILRALLMLDRDGALVVLADGSAEVLPRCRRYSDSPDPPPSLPRDKAP